MFSIWLRALLQCGFGQGTGKSDYKRTNAFRTGIKTETVTVTESIHFGHHCRDIKTNDVKCIASKIDFTVS